MRITGGKYCRRQVVCPPGIIRPAMDRMRESLFAILGDLTGCSFLDLFSGSGCVAIEAASRGASPIHMVELDRGKKATIEKNLSFVEEDKKLFMMDVNRFILSSFYQYDIVYADPPFPMEGKVDLFQKVAEHKLVKKGGLFIIHYPEEEKKLWPEEIEGFEFADERKYGRSMVRMYRAK
ncbi:MAG: 16S rRNA (guanine(966)-N(2))-methyltransferase RsmD [Spirochaetales bacterium]|nr:16S rRNA (guanine(966)-N(2))-methyltransferase RsmD [Candidatus Physcosoma equi]